MTATFASGTLDVHAGYTRKVGKHHRAQCTFLVPRAWLPRTPGSTPKVKAIQTEVVSELCATAAYRLSTAPSS